ncbi:MAG: uracil-DNA glycosylase [Candidatus Brocadiia bacterium]
MSGEEADRSSRKRILAGIKNRLLMENANGVSGIVRGGKLIPESSEILPPSSPKPQVVPQRARENELPTRRHHQLTMLSKLGSTPLPSEIMPTEVKVAELAKLHASLVECRACGVNAKRIQAVFGVGDPDAAIMFVGEAPGADEDQQGEPFVGRAGRLLTDIIEKGMKISRSQVYIANVLKCRPPENRTPTPQEAEVCGPFLERQIEIVRPRVLCALGAVPSRFLLNTDAGTSIGSLRGKIHHYRQIPLIVTYHPSYLLRNPDAKAPAWVDIKFMMATIGMQPPD